MQEQWGYSALRTGLAVALGPTLVPITSLLASRYLPRVAPGVLIAIGSTLFGLAGLWQASVTGPDPAYVREMLGPWIVSGIAVGLALPQLMAAATSALPAAQAATGSGVANMARQVGLVLGISIMVGLLGAGAPSLAHFRHVWVFMAIAAVLAAGAALVMESVRRPAPAPMPAAAD
jgi:hypothetical protein